jgi:dTDP-4-dehydrorhamnose 3,5-epimerase
MLFTPTPLQDAAIIELTPQSDERGFFARSFCQHEFSKWGLEAKIAQSNISFNHDRGTLRGMHFQRAPHSEAKLVRCISGSIYDVIIDLRPDSSTYRQWFSCELSSVNRQSLYIPEGFAHGFQTLEDNSEVLYQMFDFYSPHDAVGIRWNDPAFKINWALTPSCMSKNDLHYPDFNEEIL